MTNRFHRLVKDAPELSLVDVPCPNCKSSDHAAVATHANLRTDAFAKLIEFTKSNRILVLVGWAVPTGNWNANDDVLLTEDDLAYLETMHERYPHVRTDFEANYFRWGCGAGKEKLYIT